jgi:hypothetical protein
VTPWFSLFCRSSGTNPHNEPEVRQNRGFGVRGRRDFLKGAVFMDVFRSALLRARPCAAVADEAKSAPVRLASGGVENHHGRNPSKIFQLSGVEAQCHIDFRQPINPGSSFG